MITNRQLLLTAAFVAALTFLGVLTFAVFQARKREIGSRKTISAFDWISLERTECFGSCPAYRMTVTSTGDVTFEGYSSVACVGTRRKHIDSKTIQKLTDALNQASVLGFRDSYRNELDGCPSLWTDNPSAITTVSINGQVKRINHYHGCQEVDANAPEREKPYPAQLTLLEDRIDEILETGDWVR